MELTAEQQVEYDALYKELVAQGGPKIGKLKAAGLKDPEGVARLIELGWVNPEAPIIESGVSENTGIEYMKTNPVSAVLRKPEETELEAAKQAAEEAQEVAEEAIRKADEAKAVAKSKEPPPCPRCGGDGFWHSPKTGYRAKTATEPLIDTSKPCPLCRIPELMSALEKE
jgi:hypothetical protein